MESLLRLAFALLDGGWVPDIVAAWGARRLIGRGLALRDAEESRALHSGGLAGAARMATELAAAPIAKEQKDANEQHYEVPTRFFELCLGPRLKYSCLKYEESSTLQEAEEEALQAYLRYAEVDSLPAGATVLDLGCGWGSFCLFLAEKRPDLKVVALSNSQTQRLHIDSRAEALGLANLSAHTGDIAEFEREGFGKGRGWRGFDLVVSVEMFEHMKNYERLLAKLASWMAPKAKLLVHVFCHDRHCYHFESQGEEDWMTKYFFSGGIMPSHDLLMYFQRDLRLQRAWRWDGRHYAKTADQWLARMDDNKAEIMQAFGAPGGYGKQSAVWFYRWRLFFISVRELFGYRGGREWGVSVYLFAKP